MLLRFQLLQWQKWLANMTTVRKISADVYISKSYIHSKLKQYSNIYRKWNSEHMQNYLDICKLINEKLKLSFK